MPSHAWTTAAPLTVKRFNTDEGHRAPNPEFRRAATTSRILYFAPDLVARLTALAVERIWCSTWEKEVDTYGLSKDLGWAGQPYLRLPAPVRPWDKLVAVQEYLRSQPDRSFIWVDDDPRMVSSGMRWARTIQQPHLLIRPEKKVGLTPRDLDRIEGWLNKIGGSSPLDLA